MAYNIIMITQQRLGNTALERTKSNILQLLHITKIIKIFREN